jgi:hypothetical protein
MAHLKKYEVWSMKFSLILQIFPFVCFFGGLAQLVERLLCKQDVSGSSPLTSTMYSSRMEKFSN